MSDPGSDLQKFRDQRSDQKSEVSGAETRDQKPEKSEVRSQL
jgi:hypothetical protein